MFTPRQFCASSFLLFCLLSIGRAQGEQPGSVPQKPSQTNPTVTAAATAERVRFTAPSNVVRMQLQIISESGQVLFDVSSKGNVLDWSLQDSSGQRLQGSYLTMVTVKSLSGRLSERVGSVSIGEKQVELQRAEATQLNAAQQQAVGPIEENTDLMILKAGEAQAISVLSNNGGEGQIIRDRGALSFRLGDFFSGTDEEQMRLTEDGNLGIGTDQPQAKLDVAGTIHTTKGIEFADGTVQTTGLSGRKDKDGNIVPNASGTGTQNRLAKWADSAGTLGDSVAIDTGTGFQMTAAPSASVDTNLIYMNSTNGTIGVLAGNTPAYGAVNGPFFAMRGNDYTTFSGQRGIFTIAAGNVSSPTGLDGSVKFNTGNDQVRMVITPTGNVGVGNAAPGAKLDVTGDVNTSTQYNIGGNRILSIAGTDNAFVGFQAGLNNSSGDSNSFFGRSAGLANTTNCCGSFFGKNAGLNSSGSGNAFFGYAAGVGNVDGVANTAIGTYANVGSTNLTNATAIGAQAQVNQSNSLVLGSIKDINSASANTNVGIGVASPLATLHVVSYSTNAADNTATFWAAGIGGNQSHIHWGPTGDWYIRSAIGAGKVILQDLCCGNVGIGTNNPIAKLDVRDGSGTHGSGGLIQIGAPDANADAKAIVFGNTGCGSPLATCVSIAEQDADNRMVLRATDSFRFSGSNVLPDVDNALNLGSSTNRWSAVFAVNGTIQTSDVRLKRGITNLKYGLNQVMQLRPVSFQWKNGNDKNTHLGLIAQEVDAVMPEAVEKSADANAPLGMNYSNLIPVLIKAIQEQQVTLESAQAELKILRAENNALNSRIVAIEGTSTVATSTKKTQ